MVMLVYLRERDLGQREEYGPGEEGTLAVGFPGDAQL